MSDNHIPDILLEKYLLGELPEKKREEIDLSIRNNPVVASRVKQMEESGIEIIHQYPAEIYSSRINDAFAKAQLKKRTAQIKSGRRLKIFIPLASAGIAAVLLLLYSPFFQPLDFFGSGRGDVTQIKGEGKKLLIYRKTANGAELLKDGAGAREKDIIQIAYRTDTEAHGVILSLDGKGNVTLQFPKHAGSPTRLAAGKTVYLPDAYELDDAPDFERFFLIISKDAIDVEKVLAAAKKQIKELSPYRGAAIDFGGRFEVISFNIKKGK